MIAQQLQDLLPSIVTQINNGTNNQGNGNGESGENNTNGENNEEGREYSNLRDGDNNNNGNRYSYKEFLACQPKEFDGKGGMIAYTRWVEKMESVIDMSNCEINERVKYAIGSLTGKALTWWNTLLKSSYEKRKESHETGKQEDARSNKKRARTGKGFLATDYGKKEYKGLYPKCAKCSYHHQETTPCCTCFNCNQPGHVAKDCQVVAKRVTSVNAINSANNPRVCYECRSLDHFRNTCPKLNRAPGQVQSNPNQVLAIGGNNFNHGNNGIQAQGRAFVLGANEALHDLNIVTGLITHPHTPRPSHMLLEGLMSDTPDTPDTHLSHAGNPVSIGGTNVYEIQWKFLSLIWSRVRIDGWRSVSKG
nr:reverse transcriptase domain-containing protein [Tanacetum cinerariifolium]